MPVATAFSEGQRVAWTVPGEAGNSSTYGSDGVTIVNGETYEGTISRIWEPLELRDENDEPYMEEPRATVELDVGTRRVAELRALRPLSPQVG